MLEFYSTNNKNLRVSLREAVLSGLALDGGLFMPNEINKLSKDFFQRLPSLSFVEMAYEVAHTFLQNSIPANKLLDMVTKAFDFDVPIVKLQNDIYVTELFWGPTLSFKDFGARFMAQLMAYFREGEELHILAATSGDTGSAIADGFFNVPGIKVWILYPKGQVSPLQEMQLTSMGGNVTALEVEGQFDDCQALVKQAFQDLDLKKQRHLSSANSISIARLIPQMFYYFWIWGQIKKIKPQSSLVVSVPSGNFGNLTAGLIAKRMGLEIHRFIAATNSNDAVPRYLESGKYQATSSKHTLSNAMDVGNPSNFARILDLYAHDVKAIRNDIWAKSFTDAQTIEALTELTLKYHYQADPHGAVAYLGLTHYLAQHKDSVGVLLETAHPAKFIEVLEPIFKTKITLPQSLELLIHKPKIARPLANDYKALKQVLLSSFFHKG